MKKTYILLLLIIFGFIVSLMPVFANDEGSEDYGGCKIVKEENGCYLLQDDQGNTEWVCERNDGIETYEIKCTLDCWNFD